MLQAELGMVKDRLVPPVMNGAPKGPAGLRVSATRQGVTGTKRKPAGGDTVMMLLLPVMDETNRSLAVRVCVPSVTREAENVPTPLLRVASRGRVAETSVLVKWTRSE